jgi:catechol 2,3-dioxygenase
MAIDPALRISAVELAVSDVDRSADFYERVLGLPLSARDDARAELGGDGPQPALVLTQLPAPTPLPPAATGLYHVAWLHQNRADLAATVKRVAQARWPFEGASDHGVSEAVYLADPDGLGIEIYADRPRADWRAAPDGHGVLMYTLPLDVEDLLAQAPAQTPAAIADGTAIGHVHLKVADVGRTRDFYVDVLGFDEQAALPSAAFVAAGGYHHHVGLNSWQSAGHGPAPDSAPGLRRVDFALPGPSALDTLAGKLEAGGGEREAERVVVRDPDGELLVFAQA